MWANTGNKEQFNRSVDETEQIDLPTEHIQDEQQEDMPIDRGGDAGADDKKEYTEADSQTDGEEKPKIDNEENKREQIR